MRASFARLHQWLTLILPGLADAAFPMPPVVPGFYELPMWFHPEALERRRPSAEAERPGT